MTDPRALAEKIRQCQNGDCLCVSHEVEWLESLISAALDEAVDDAQIKWERYLIKAVGETAEKVRKQTYEDAAKIAESPIMNYEGRKPEKCYECDCHGEHPQDYIAKQIRRRAGEVK